MLNEFPEPHKFIACSLPHPTGRYHWRYHSNLSPSHDKYTMKKEIACRKNNNNIVTAFCFSFFFSLCFWIVFFILFLDASSHQTQQKIKKLIHAMRTIFAVAMAYVWKKSFYAMASDIVLMAPMNSKQIVTMSALITKSLVNLPFKSKNNHFLHLNQHVTMFNSSKITISASKFTNQLIKCFFVSKLFIPFNIE